MTYLLQNDEDILNWHEFDTEQAARDWVEDNLERSDYGNWTLLDPEGGTWCL